MIGFQKALDLVRTTLKPLTPVEVPVTEAVGLVLAEDLYAQTDVPKEAVSLKDGYAVRSRDVEGASPQNPKVLALMGEILAGEEKDLALKPGSCVRVTAGALLPRGTEAVLAEEFATPEGKSVKATADAPPGKNILPRGADISKGSLLLARGQRLFPPEVGLMAAGGWARIKVHPRPRVFLLATGSEVVAPGHPLRAGQIYASNLVTLAGWCHYFGFSWTSRVVEDEPAALKKALGDFLAGPWEVLLTSGGAWRGPKDLVVKGLDEAGWQKIFHRVRMGPGKAVAFGLLKEKVVFCLPGGPPSNQMAFLNLALPGLFILAGEKDVPFPEIPVRLTETVEGQRDWTQFFLGRLKRKGEKIYFTPLKPRSRLSYLAAGEALLTLPEGKERLAAGEEVCVRVLKEWPPCPST